jgi:hypothetical protein
MKNIQFCSARQRGLIFLIAICLVLPITNCTVKFLSDYDQLTDQLAQDLYKSLAKLEIDDENYEAELKEIGAKIKVLKARAESITKNEPTVKAVTALEKNYQTLVTIESETAFQIAVDTMLQQAKQIMDLEIKKKRGVK